MTSLPNTLTRRGRPTKPYRTSWGEEIHGLYKSLTRPGQWRVIATGERFTSHDEKVAVHLFRQKMKDHENTVTFPLGTPTKQVTGDDILAEMAGEAIGLDPAFIAKREATDTIEGPNGEEIYVQKINEAKMWAWFREQLLTRPEYIAKLTGLPELAGWRYMPIPKAAIKLQTLADTYDAHSPSNWRTKGQVKAAMKRLQKLTGAETVNDLDTQTLIDFRQKVNAALEPTGASQIFSKIKAALAFGIKYGLDSAQLSAALTRLKTLYAPPSTSTAKPQPISPADFNKLLDASNTEWRAILLLSLNMALYLEDVCTLRWEDFDLQAGTYTGKRNKTSVIRVGILWPETMEAMKALPRKGKSPLLFTSQTGLRFNTSSKYDTYASLRKQVSVESPFSSIRDAAYTAAAASCDEKTAKLFAAHRFGGLMDSYVQRKPALVKPASDAVHAAYAPFPKEPSA